MEVAPLYGGEATNGVEGRAALLRRGDQRR